MIHYIKGNILESKAEALVNTVNLMGIMGKGIALQFKNQFPDNFKAYKKACKDKTIGIGKLLVVKENTIFGEKLIINFPTKTDWKKSSEYSYIETGLKDLTQIINDYGIKSIAIPPLGAGNGGLNWMVVKSLIERNMSMLNIDIFIYEPNAFITDQLKKEKVKLTKARALLLYMLFDLVKHGEFVSEFSSEKICYFLQKFGAENLFKLHYEPKYYGPYSGKVRFVLNALNGSYITGYSDMSKKPFEPLSLIPDAYDDVKSIVEKDITLKKIADKTILFLDGFYSDFGLELLSSTDYIIAQYGDIPANEIYCHLSKWNHRKSKIFNDLSLIETTKQHILRFSQSLYVK